MYIRLGLPHFGVVGTSSREARAKTEAVGRKGGREGGFYIGMCMIGCWCVRVGVTRGLLLHVQNERKTKVSPEGG